MVGGETWEWKKGCSSACGGDGTTDVYKMHNMGKGLVKEVVAIRSSHHTGVENITEPRET